MASKKVEMYAKKRYEFSRKTSIFYLKLFDSPILMLIAQK